MPKERHPPRVTAATQKDLEAKRERLAAELRANLARRKAQARQRKTGPDKVSGKDGMSP